jgi:hypothetical protein
LSAWLGAARKAAVQTFQFPPNFFSFGILPLALLLRDQVAIDRRGA